MKTKECCAHCGASVVSYNHSLNAGMVKGLILLEKAGGTSLFSDLDLTFNQKNNFQKLRYWYLITSPEPGVWSLTNEGMDFLLGKTTMPKRVTTFRAERVLTDEKIEKITVFDALKDHAYWYKNDYLKNIKAYE